MGMAAGLRDLESYTNGPPNVTMEGRWIPEAIGPSNKQLC